MACKSHLRKSIEVFVSSNQQFLIDCRGIDPFHTILLRCKRLRVEVGDEETIT